MSCVASPAVLNSIRDMKFLHMLESCSEYQKQESHLIALVLLFSGKNVAKSQSLSGHDLSKTPTFKHNPAYGCLWMPTRVFMTCANFLPPQYFIPQAAQALAREKDDDQETSEVEEQWD